jgi:hypothetical protein
MSIENPLWGAPKIHGELLKLGIDVAQSTVSIYMVPRQVRPLQTWKIFLRNHVEEVASIDLFVVRHCHIVERRTREFCVPNIFKRPRLPRATCS